MFTLALALAITAAPGVPSTVWISDDGESVEATLRVVERAPAPCPCDLSRAYSEPNVSHNDIARCSCPALLDAARARLASCAEPLVKQTLTADVNGRVNVTPRKTPTYVDVTTSDRVAWATLDGGGPFSIELDHPWRPSFAIEGDVERAALLYEDGHCVPMVRDAKGEFVPSRLVPRHVSSHLAVRYGDGEIALRWFHGSGYPLREEIERHARVSTIGLCAPHAAVQATTPYEDVRDIADDDGRFELTLPHGPARVSCGGDVWQYSSGHRFGRGGFSTVVDPEAHMAQQRERAGTCTWLRIVDGTGRPLAKASVERVGKGDDFSLTWGGLHTSSDGQVCVGGTDRIDIEAPLSIGGACAGSKRVDVSELPKRAGAIDIRLDTRPIPTGVLSVRVLSHDGKPVPNATVDVWHATQPDGCKARIQRSLLQTALDGTLRVPVVRGRATIHVRDGYGGTFDVDVDKATDVALKRGAVLNVRVLDVDGAPARGGWVAVRSDADSQLHDLVHVEDDRDGRVRFRGLHAGEHEVTWKPNDEGELGHRRSTTTVRVDDDATHDLELRWPRGLTIRGVVLDELGAPVPHATVDAWPEGTASLEGRSPDDGIQITADAQGRFTFVHVRAGRWVLSEASRRSRPGSITVNAGNESVRLVRR